MANRSNHSGSNISEGQIALETSFMTNGTSSPVVAASLTGPPVGTGLSVAQGNTLRGEGLASVVRTGVGTFLATMEPNWTFVSVQTAYADLDNIAADGSYATIGTFSNVGAAAVNGVYPQVTFVCETRAASGTLTDFGPGGTGVSRRLSISCVFKLTAVGK